MAEFKLEAERGEEKGADWQAVNAVVIHRAGNRTENFIFGPLWNQT